MALQGARACHVGGYRQHALATGRGLAVKIGRSRSPMTKPCRRAGFCRGCGVQQPGGVGTNNPEGRTARDRGGASQHVTRTSEPSGTVRRAIPCRGCSKGRGRTQIVPKVGSCCKRLGILGTGSQETRAHCVAIPRGRGVVLLHETWYLSVYRVNHRKVLQ